MNWSAAAPKAPPEYKLGAKATAILYLPSQEEANIVTDQPTLVFFLLEKLRHFLKCSGQLFARAARRQRAQMAR